MNEAFSRTELLLGAEAMEKLARAHVAVFGIGGVGGYVCEALVRAGVGAFDLIDSDVISVSNRNRQIIATSKTVGRDKVEVMKERMLDIAPEVRVTARKCFFLPENEGDFPFESYDYMVDAIDNVTAKIALARISQEKGIPLISAMGTGNKLNPSLFRVADIADTKMDPLCRVMRKELKKRGICRLKVVYSEEEPLPAYSEEKKPDGRRSIPGSCSFVPAAAGLLIASEVVKDLIAKTVKN